MLLAKEQRLAAALLFGLALIAWIVVAVWPSRQPEQTPAPHKKSWAERRDSIRIADSLRYARWAAEREQRYDSFRIADSLRRLERRAELLRYRDSARLADSLWRDSAGLHFTPRIKKDTVLDLNHCDTAQLQLIRGIGRFSAVQIVRYRERLNGFYSPKQLTDEPLLQLHLDTLLHHFTANPDDVQRIPVNSCSMDRLQHHPYLRYEQAKAIYEFRRRNLRINDLDDLRALPELTEQDLLRLYPYLSFE